MKKLTTKKSMTSKRLERQDEFSSYVGVDLGDKHSCLCILDRWGRIAAELRGRTTVKEFEEFFGKQPRSRVAMEAGSQSRWVCEIAKKHGHEVYVANPHKVQYISGGDDKNDPGDAYKLAELSYVRPSMLHAISHRKRQEQVHLEAIRARDLLVRSRADMINAVRGMSKAFAETLVQCSAESFTTKAAGKLPEALRSATAPLLRVIDQLSEEVAASPDTLPRPGSAAASPDTLPRPGSAGSAPRLPASTCMSPPSTSPPHSPSPATDMPDTVAAPRARSTDPARPPLRSTGR